MLTRKHFRSVADVINRAAEQLHHETLTNYSITNSEFRRGAYSMRKHIAYELARHFSNENPNFDSQKFLNRCFPDRPIRPLQEQKQKQQKPQSTKSQKG